MKFLADSSLGRLSTWLRILGYDTVYWRGEADRSFLRKAEKEGRAVLTRKKDVLKRNHSGIIVFVENDHLEDQIGEVLGKLDLAPMPETFFTICPECNVALNRMTRDEVRSDIPDYVYRTQQDFRRCPGCGRTYWPGTHRERIMKTLEKLIKDVIPGEPQASSRKPRSQ
jgi:uncharacterized protein with PIN domain